MHISGSRVIHIVMVLCLSPPSVWYLSFISKSSQNWRQDLFQMWKLYRRTRTPSKLLSISGVIRILMRVIRLTNGKPCRCYYTCGYMIFMTWVISQNNFTVMWHTYIHTWPASVAQLDAPSDWRPGGRGFTPHPRRGRQHSFVEIDHEIFSTVILSLPLIQEGQLSDCGERMCTILVNRLED